MNSRTHTSTSTNARQPCCCHMEAEVEQEHDWAELENYQAWESEHCKWKAHEERLLEQLQQSQQQSSGSLVNVDTESDRQPSREVRKRQQDAGACNVVTRSFTRMGMVVVHIWTILNHRFFLNVCVWKKKNNPFSGKFLTKQIKVCQGCQKQFHDNNTDPPSLHDWSAGSFWLKLKCLQESPSHYHPRLSCIHMVFPLFQRSTNLSFDTWTQGILGKLLGGLVDILDVPICVVSCVL